MTTAKRTYPLALAALHCPCRQRGAPRPRGPPRPAAGNTTTTFGDDVSLYVSSDDTHSVLAYDGKTGAFQRTFASGGGLIEPEGIAFGPDGNLYVSSRSDEVLRYDGKTGKFIDVFASGHGLNDPAGIAFGGPDNDLFVSSGLTDDGHGNQILRFDGRTGAFKAVVDPANEAGLDDPEALTFGSDGLLYVASTPEEGPGEVLRYNPANNRFVDKFVPKSKARSWTRPAWSSAPTATCSSAAPRRARSSATTARLAPSKASSSPPASAASMRPRAWRSARTATSSSQASWATRCWSTTAPPAHSSVSSSPRGAAAFRSRRSSSSDPEA